jgi:hypothetical protein
LNDCERELASLQPLASPGSAVTIGYGKDQLDNEGWSLCGQIVNLGADKTVEDRCRCVSVGIDMSLKPCGMTLQDDVEELQLVLKRNHQTGIWATLVSHGQLDEQTGANKNVRMHFLSFLNRVCLAEQFE